jgi:hypothetical protein
VPVDLAWPDLKDARFHKAVRNPVWIRADAELVRQHIRRAERYEPQGRRLRAGSLDCIVDRAIATGDCQDIGVV